MSFIRRLALLFLTCQTTFFVLVVLQAGLQPGEVFGVRSIPQLLGDLSHLAVQALWFRERYRFSISSVGLLRPRLSIPAYLGLPNHGSCAVYNLFDQTLGGREFGPDVSRDVCRDSRGQRLTYDAHDGLDIVLPIGTELVSAADGVVAGVRDRWLRGGITVIVDHLNGWVTQYTHCSRVLVQVGQHVQRGDAVALSGAAGVDLVINFPWVPPHIHFMTWYLGKPVDPLSVLPLSLKDGVLDRTFVQPTATVHKEPVAVEIPRSANASALAKVLSMCKGAGLVEELFNASTMTQLAVLEDVLHHEPWACNLPKDCVRPTIRLPPQSFAYQIKFDLPVSSRVCKRLYLADSWWTEFW